jgi:hypothetical protein
MISEQIALNIPTRTLVTGTPRAAFVHAQLTAVRRSVASLTGALRAWARVPALPYAAMWEASVVVDLVTDQKFYEPDPFATGRSYLTDSWLHR